MQQVHDGLHSVFVVCFDYLILLKGTEIERFLAKALTELLILVVQLFELVMNNLDVFWVVEVNVQFFAIFLFSVFAWSSLPLVLFVVIVFNDFS